MAESGGKTKLLTVQAGRGLAALLILLFHLSNGVFKTLWESDPLGGAFRFGHAGIALFFVISGFTLFYAYGGAFGKPRKIGFYLWRRLTRLYPAYWVLLCVLLFFAATFPESSASYVQEPSVVLSSFLLVHVSTDLSILGVSWTLFHGVAFYLVFLFLLADKRVGGVLFFLWLAGSLVMLRGEPATTLRTFMEEPSTLGFWFSPLHLLFGFGALAGWLTRRGGVVGASFLAVFGAVLFFGAGLEEDYVGSFSRSLLTLLYGAGGACLLLGLASMEREERIVIPGDLAAFGDWAYSIFLTNLLIMSNLGRAFIVAGVNESLPAIVCYVMLLSLTLFFCFLFHHAVEKPAAQGVAFLEKTFKTLWRPR